MAFVFHLGNCELNCTLSDVIGGIAILIVLSTLLITLPENLLKSENTPYVFDNAGWYEQWTDETGEITG